MDAHQLRLARALKLFQSLRRELEEFVEQRPFTFAHTVRPAREDEVRRFAALRSSCPVAYTSRPTEPTSLRMKQ